MDHALRGDFLPYVPAGLSEQAADEANLQIFRAYHGQHPEQVPDELFRLRYEVYCKERGYLPADPALGGRERDEYDACSTHFAAYSEQQTLVGTVRLVTPPAQRVYPFERHCVTFDAFRMPPRAKCAEVSRLAVARSHRRRRGDSVQGVPGYGGQRHDDRASPMLLLGMYREMYRHSRSQGIRYWFAAMERALAHSLTRMGFTFDAIGPQADYYGKVTPYVLDLGALLPVLSAQNPPLLAWFDQ